MEPAHLLQRMEMGASCSGRVGTSEGIQSATSAVLMVQGIYRIASERSAELSAGQPKSSRYRHGRRHDRRARAS